MSMTPVEAFRASYALNLAKARHAKPDVYAWPIEELPIVVDKMMVALTLGRANIDSPAIKAACKAVHLKPGMARIRDFLACKTWEEAMLKELVQ
jgi:hypothetical protein